MWNNLRARHYSVLILVAIILLEMSAITIDKVFGRSNVAAVALESPFQNNVYLCELSQAEYDEEGTYADAEETDEVYTSNNEKIALVAVDADSNSSVSETVAQVMQVAAASEVSEAVKAAEEVETPEAVEASVDKIFPDYFEYSVKAGDSISEIASRYGADSSDIARINKISSDQVIKVGETIRVPMPSGKLQYVVRSGDSISVIAARFKVSQNEIIKANGLSSYVIRPEQKLTIPVSAVTAAKPVSLLESNKIASVEKTVSGNVKMAMAPAAKLSDHLASDKAGSNSDSKVASADKDKPFEYRIISGDSLSKLARKYNTTTAQIQFDNNMTGTMVRVGQVIKISPNKKMYRILTSKKPVEGAKVISYKVKRGDSLSVIASKYNTTVDSIVSQNNMKSTEVLAGQVLKITPGQKMYHISSTRSGSKNEVTVVKHKVAKGESLSVIAEKYRTTVSAIMAQNRMKSAAVMAGQTIKVPSGSGYRISSIARNSKRTSWKRPTRGYVSSPYGWRMHPIHKSRKFHSGVDLAAPKGTPIVAAVAGKVIFVGRRGGYGNLIIIKHTDGYSTRYAHCSSIIAKNGQQVKAGQIIGRVGATGVATGNHLHFEVRKDGKTKNPLAYVSVK